MGDELTGGGRKMKLPFVWELDSQGVVSHCIATHHQLPKTYLLEYSEDIRKILQGKKQALLEVERFPESTLLIASKRPLPAGAEYDCTTYNSLQRMAQDHQRRLHENADGIDGLIEAIAFSLSIAVEGLHTKEEHEGYLKALTNPPQPSLIAEANRLWVERSITYLDAARGPSLIAAGLAHFWSIEPSMITMYQEKGIKVERVQ